MKNQQLPIVIAFLGLFTANFAFGQSHSKAVKDYLDTTEKLGRDVKNREFVIDSEDASTSLKGTVVNIRQTYDGIPVFGNEATLLMRGNSVLNFAGNFSKNSAKVAGKSQAADAATILVKAAQNLKFSDPQSYAVTLAEGKMKEPELVYFDNGNDLVLSYELEFEDKAAHNLWMIVADAKTGEVYSQQNLTLSCNFMDEPYKGESHITRHPEIFPQKGSANTNPVTPLLADNASYRVFAFPVEAPSFGARTLISNPWDLALSPEGWHSTGTNSYTTARGNNVHVYTDMDNLDTPQFEVDGGSSRNFDFPLDLSYWPTGSPGTGYTDAALTNLFYVNNRVHDILYKFGFTESAKNFQANNFGKGGNGNDYVKAEARDGSGTNNANFSTPSDGGNGKMQMYIWYPNGTLPQVFFINTPPEHSSRVISVGRGYFGSPLSTTPLTADLKIPNIIDGCTPITAGSLTGKIAYIKRGDCNFSVKVRNAQDAGAVAVVIANNKVEDTDTQISNMIGSTDPGIVIPSVFINKLDAAFFDGLLSAGNVNITLKEADLVPRDANLDNGVIAHEYGHGLSNRTTGTSVGCLNTNADNEQMGEGWSDFLALMFTMKPTDNASVPRGIGTYLSFQPTSGVGIRPAQYSPDPAINDYTYGDTNGMVINGSPDVHSIGFIWASILWDLHWKYVEKYGFNNDLTADSNSGSARVFQLVLDGLKLQGCLPTFIMGRDGILAADQASTNGANKCLIWNVFAKRGVGVNASAGSKTNINDQVEDFTVPAECALATSEIGANNTISIYPNPAKNEFFLNIKGNVLGKVDVEIFDASGKLVSGQKVDVSNKEAITTQNLPNGVYIVKASGLGFEYSSKLIIKK